MRLEAKLQELKTQFHLADQDLNLHFGPDRTFDLV